MTVGIGKGTGEDIQVIYNSLGRSQVVRQRILIPPFPGSSPGAPARSSFEGKALFGRTARSTFVIPKFFPRFIPKFCSRRVRQARDPVCMPLPGRRECPFHRSLGVPLIGPALVCRERASLTVREFSFFELGHSTVPAGIEGERRRQSSLIAQSAIQLGHAALRIELGWLGPPVFGLVPRFVEDHRNAATRHVG